jgi:hypothetical protein
MDVIQFYAVIGRDLDLPVWATEQNHTHLAAPDRHEWSHALNNASCLHDILVQGGVSLSLYFSYAMSSSGGLALYIPETKSWAPAYSMLKNFYNHIPPGSQRILSTPTADSGLRSVAFRLPDRSTIALVLINEWKASRTVTVSLGNGSPAIRQVFLSDRTRHHSLVPFHQISPVGTGLTLPPESVSTLLLTQ